MADRTLSRAEEIYHAVLARQPAERQAFLDEACQEDQKLLAEVKDLLAFQADAKRLLDEPVAEAATQPLALAKGARLGHYEVAELIDAGGMGEVYRARDTKLQRDVALKVLPAAFSRDSERVVRLEREARLLAALSDPHIEAIHGLEEFDGRHALALELVPGQTLAERIARGPIPTSEALELARQMAEALEAAHEKGVIHRDIKPANVKLTPDGQVKLLDFGLAKALGTGADEEQPGRDATADGTRSGLILGTARYMSPEQAQGQTLDERTDIWSFGTVLFEMLAGERAFGGETTPEVLASLLGGEPRWDALPHDCPPSVTRLLHRCLRKRLRERLQAIGDARIELEEVQAGTTPAGAATDARPSATRAVRRLMRQRLALAVAVVVLLTGLLAVRWWPPARGNAREAPIVRSHIDLTAERPLLGYGRDHHPVRTELTLSPDGRLLVWAASPDGRRERSALRLQRLDTGEVTRLERTEGASQPFFSPDGRWIGFCASEEPGGCRLRKIPTEGGLAVDLAELDQRPLGAWWGPDGTIFLGSLGELNEELAAIHAISATGGALRRITTIDPSREARHQLPSVLPGGRTLVFTTMPNIWGVKTRVEALSLADGERKVLVEDAADARYLPTGHLVFARRGTLLAAPFDPDRAELTGPPVPVVEGVSHALGQGGSHSGVAAAQFAVSDSGLLIYASGGMHPTRPVELLLVDETGHTDPLPGFDKQLVSSQMRYSPDGRQLAFNEQSGRLWLFDVERQTYRVLSEGGVAGSPVWSPDGRRLAAHWSEVGPLQLSIIPIEGGEWERLTEVAQEEWPQSWSSDGRFLAFVRFGGEGPETLIYRFDDRQVVSFLPGAIRPAFSPDGRWLAFDSRRSGQREVYVTSFPDGAKTLTVSRGGGYAPAWSRDGRTLFYYSRPAPDDGRRSMMAVPVRPGPEPSLGSPRTLFRLPDGFRAMVTRSYDLHPDGRRFVIGRPLEREAQPPITQLTVVHNWFAELERLNPTQPSPGSP